MTRKHILPLQGMTACWLCAVYVWHIKKEAISRGVFTPKYLNLTVLVHGLKSMTSSQQSSSCFLGSSTWMNGSSDGPYVPCYHLTPTSWSTTSKSFVFTSVPSAVWTFRVFAANTAGIYRVSIKNGKTKRHQVFVVCDPDALRRLRLAERRMNRERINPDEWVHGEYSTIQRNEMGGLRVNYGFILCGLWGETVCLKSERGWFLRGNPPRLDGEKIASGHRRPLGNADRNPDLISRPPAAG